jgi:hypothetical protein
MRVRLIALLVISPLLFSSLLSTSHAAAKAGAKCKKEGIKTVVGKTTFTCIKSGKKLVWAKAVSSNSSSGKTSPSAAPTPSQTQTPNVTPSTVRAGVKAVLDSFAQFPKSKDAPQEISFIFGPNADKDTSDLIVKNASATMGLFVDFYQDSKAYPIFYGSNEDLEWVIAQWAKFGYTEQTIGNEFQYAVRNLRTRSVPPNFFVGSENRFPQTPMILLGSKAAISKLTPPWRQIVINHHVIHGIQGRITGYKDALLGCWGREGGAELYGWLVAHRTLQAQNFDYVQFRRNQMGEWINTQPNIDLRKFDDAQWFQALKSLEGNKFEQAIYCADATPGALQYNVGALVYERLIGEFGHQQVMSWWYEMRSTSDWKVAFEKVFKIGIDDWYRSSAVPYLRQEYRDWVPQPGWRGVG